MPEFAQEEKKEETAEKQNVESELQQVNGPQGGMLPSAVSERIQRKRGTGDALPNDDKDKYSSLFGRDMSDVRIHSDAESNTLSRSLNARAFTIGSDIFLSQGIHPDRGGRDRETLTHELTHVAQQHGHAGSGSLRVGAADTAQEHEAESTAAGNVSASLSSHDTVQRGFWSSLASSIGNNVLEGMGLKEAYEDFSAGQDKVAAAVKKMEPADKTAFEQQKSGLAEAKKALEEKEAAADKAEKAYKEQENAANAQSSAPGGAAQAVDKTALNNAVAEYEQSYAAYQKKQNKRLELLQKVDASITEEDLAKYDSSKTKKFFSVIGSSFGGAILGLFSGNAGKEQENRAMINNWATSEKKEHKDYSAKGTPMAGGNVSIDGEMKEVLKLDEQYPVILKSLFREMKDEDWMKDSAMTEADLITQMDSNAEAKAEVKRRIADAMAPLLTINKEEIGNLQTARERKLEIDKILEVHETAYNEGLVKKNEYEQDQPLYASKKQVIDNKQAEIDAKQQELDHADEVSQPNIRNALTQLQNQKKELEGDEDWKDLVKRKSVWEDATKGPRKSYEAAVNAGIEDALRDKNTNYNGNGVPIAAYIGSQETSLQNKLNHAYTNMKGSLAPKDLENLKSSVRSVVMKQMKEKNQAMKTQAATESTAAENRFNSAQAEISARAAKSLDTQTWVQSLQIFKVPASKLSISNADREKSIKEGMVKVEDMRSAWSGLEDRTRKQGPLSEDEKKKFTSQIVKAYSDFLVKLEKEPGNVSRGGTKDGYKTPNDFKAKVFEKVSANLKGEGKVFSGNDATDVKFLALFGGDGACKKEMDRVLAMISNGVPMDAEKEAQNIADKINKLKDPEVQGQERRSSIIEKIWSLVQEDPDLKKQYRNAKYFKTKIMAQPAVDKALKEVESDMGTSVEDAAGYVLEALRFKDEAQ